MMLPKMHFLVAWACIGLALAMPLQKAFGHGALEKM
jgi:hypothetical protein